MPAAENNLEEFQSGTLQTYKLGLPCSEDFCVAEFSFCSSIYFVKTRSVSCLIFFNVDTICFTDVSPFPSLILYESDVHSEFSLMFTVAAIFLILLQTQDEVCVKP